MLLLSHCIGLHMISDILQDIFMYTLLPKFIQFDMQVSRYKHVSSSRAENSVGPDQLASQQPADLSLQCLQILVIVLTLNPL